MSKRLDEFTKAAVVLGVRNGAMSRADACKKYSLSAAELALWELAYDHEGIAGLRDRNLSARRHAGATDRYWGQTCLSPLVAPALSHSAAWPTRRGNSLPILRPAQSIPKSK